MPRIKGNYYLYREKFKKLYHKVGYTQETLCKACDEMEDVTITLRSLRGWLQEKEQRPIPLNKAEKLAELLGVKAFDIVGEDGISSYNEKNSEDARKTVIDSNLLKHRLVELLKEMGTPLPEFDDDDQLGAYLTFLLDTIESINNHYLSLIYMIETYKRFPQGGLNYSVTSLEDYDKLTKKNHEKAENNPPPPLPNDSEIPDTENWDVLDQIRHLKNLQK